MLWIVKVITFVHQCPCPPLTQPATSNSTRAHHEMRYPIVTWHIILYDYLFTTELRHTYYRPNAHRFTKSALCILYPLSAFL